MAAPRITAESQLLAEVIRGSDFIRRLQGGGTPREFDSLTILLSILKRPLLRGLLYTAKGERFRFEDQKLVWHVVEPPEAPDDYAIELRRTKGQVAQDLPPRIEEDVICELEGVQRDLYRAEYKKARAMLLGAAIAEKFNDLKFHFLSSLTRLRQICCHPALVDAAQRTQPAAKVEALVDLLEPLIEEGHKVLVFSQFASMLELLQEEVRERNWTEFFLTGQTEDRGPLVDSFNAHDGAALFLISLKAGGFGLNLTSASYVVLFDPWWNPAVEAQAIDRTHRIGQTQTVIAYRLIVKGSIEEKIRELQKAKSMMAGDTLGEDRFNQALTLDDFRYLFDSAEAAL